MIINRALLKKIAANMNAQKLSAMMPDISGLIEDRERRKLARLCQKHHIPIPQFTVKREAYWPDGSLVWEPRLDWGHSPVRNSYNYLFQHMNFKSLDDSTFGAGLLSLTDTGSTVRYDSPNHRAFEPDEALDLDARSASQGILAQAGDDTLGIVVGTDSTAFSFEHYALQTLIDNGSGSGELDYSQSELHSVTWASSILKDTRVRDFNNNSGGSITVEELGEYVGPTVAGVTTYVIMMIRELTGGDAVADTAQYRVTLECSLTFP